MPEPQPTPAALEALSTKLGALEVKLAEDKADHEAATKRYAARLREVRGLKAEVEAMRAALTGQLRTDGEEVGGKV